MPDYCVIDNIFAGKRAKKIITAFLILVLVLQLLPIRQAVRYFWIDNMTTEEIVHMDKGASKIPNPLDEDHKLLSPFNYTLPKFAFANNTPYFHLNEALPLLHPADIQTPPPNFL